MDSSAKLPPFPKLGTVQDRSWCLEVLSKTMYLWALVNPQLGCSIFLQTWQGTCCPNTLKKFLSCKRRWPQKMLYIWACAGILCAILLLKTQTEGLWHPCTEQVYLYIPPIPSILLPWSLYCILVDHSSLEFITIFVTVVCIQRSLMFRTVMVSGHQEPQP